MRDQQQKFESYLEKQATACHRRGKSLAEDGRIDEGNFEKVRANVYEIFKTILSVGERLHGADEEAQRRFFLERAEQIPASWSDSYEKAKENGDMEKMHIESVKLDTIREIKEMCAQIWGENT